MTFSITILHAKRRPKAAGIQLVLLRNEIIDQKLKTKNKTRKEDSNMTLVRRNKDLFPSLPSVFDDFLPGNLFDWSGSEGNYGSSLPAVNVMEEDDKFQIEVAAPGMTKDDFNVEIDNNVLTISSEKEQKDEEKGENGKINKREFRYAAFKRSFTLPEGAINEDKINAQYKDGILHLTLPKKDEAKRKPVRTINIS